MMGANLLGHGVEGDALGAGNAALLRVVGKGAEYEKTAIGYGIKESIGGFIVLAKTIIGEVDNGMFLIKEHI